MGVEGALAELEDGGGTGGTGRGSAVGDEDTLSEEDKRTLVVGGWLQDTKRAVIIEEAKEILTREDAQAKVDATELHVFGPRRAFGLLRFVRRGEETYAGMRDRMWDVIKAIRGAEHVLPSTRGGVAGDGEGKRIWASFTKTRAARRRGGHASLVRRVAQTAVDEAEQSDRVVIEAKEHDYYEVDWNSGTVWAGAHKLGSAVHRAPRGEHVRTMGGGWVDTASIAEAIGVPEAAVTAVLNREL